MSPQFRASRKMLYVVIASVSLNLFLVGGLVTHLALDRSRNNGEMAAKPNRDKAVPPPLRALNHIIDRAYPDLSRGGQAEVRLLRNELKAAFEDLRPVFREHRDDLRKIFGAEAVDAEALEQQLRTMLNSRDKVDEILIRALKEVSYKLDREDREILLKAVERPFRKRKQG